jgi:hypothetical protein
MVSSIAEGCFSDNSIEFRYKIASLIPFHEATTMHCRIRAYPQGIVLVSDKMRGRHNVVVLGNDTAA